MSGIYNNINNFKRLVKEEYSKHKESILHGDDLDNIFLEPVFPKFSRFISYNATIKWPFCKIGNKMLYVDTNNDIFVANINKRGRIVDNMQRLMTLYDILPGYRWEDIKKIIDDYKMYCCVKRFQNE